MFMQNVLPDTQAAFFGINTNKATREVTQMETRSNLMAELYVIFFYFFLRGLMCPFGSGSRHDTHSWDQTEDVAASVFRLSSRFRPHLALSQPSQPPHAEPLATMSHHTNISPQPSSHQSDALRKLHPSTSNPWLLPCHPLCTQLHREDPSDKQSLVNPPPNVGAKHDRDILIQLELSRDQSSSAKLLGSGTTC